MFDGQLPVFASSLAAAALAAIRQDLDLEASELLLIILPGRSGAPMATAAGRWDLTEFHQI